MATDLVVKLLPALGRSLRAEFNVFDVMHHGTHEKQLSNVFAWLLEASGSHGLGDRFLHMFLDEVNRGQSVQRYFNPEHPYRVLQEVNTTDLALGADIADIVLESTDAVVVIENYFTSDGHGHSYDGYLNHGLRDGRQAAVVLLCRDEDRSLLSAGWEQAVVVTYGTIVGRLHAEVAGDAAYKKTHPEAYAFIVQMYRKFVGGKGPMQDRDVLEFVVAMCEAGEGGRYGRIPLDKAAERFANDISQQALERFGEGVDLMQAIKDRLKTFTQRILAPQLEQALGPGSVGAVKANWQGIWRWSVRFDLGQGATQTEIAVLFGPSAWQQSQDIDSDRAFNASHLYLYRQSASMKELRRSSVSLQNVLDGLSADELRLRDDVMALAGHEGGARGPMA